MSVGNLGNVSSLQPNWTFKEKVSNWATKHPTVAKVLQIASIILAVGLLIAMPIFGSAISAAVVISLLATSVVCYVAGHVLSSLKQSTPLQSTQEEGLSWTGEEMWNLLEKRTEKESQGLETFSQTELHHRFNDVVCPKKTAVSVAGRYLHANSLEPAVAHRRFVLSQAPLPQDLPLFWQMIFDQEMPIIDLTTVSDQQTGGVVPYYPLQLNQEIQYGHITVKLIETQGYLHTYQIQSNGVVKTVKRLHYPEWKDFGAVSLPTLQFLVAQVEALSPDPSKPLCIHCRAGVGRTGTLTTAWIAKKLIELGQMTKKNVDVLLLDLIARLRQQRGPYFVQQPVQLELVRQYARSLLGNQR